MIGLIVKLLFASNSYAQTAYYSYSTYSYFNKTFKKQFQKPVNGYIYRKKYYKGIFIRPNYTSSYVRSASSGVVIFSGFLKYYGNVVIIKHKNNFKTVYAKIRKIYVKNGQYVKKGQVIGTIYKNKPLYFEVRRNITPVNAYALLK